MTDRIADVEAALERVVVAVRHHLAAVIAADGQPDDDSVWDAYVGLNNASHDYDDLLNDVFGEVTPWDLEAISPEQAPGGRLGTVVSGDSDDEVKLPADDPYPRVVSVRQRRDYRIPSASALFHLAEEGRPVAPSGESHAPIIAVADAILELLQSGDGSLGMLDVQELEPLDGVVVVAEVGRPLNAEGHEEADAGPEAPFRIGEPDRVLGRLDERSLAGTDD
jgi:hypothetical protein